MRTDTALKLGQVAGALLMAAGVTACSLDHHPSTAPLMLAGALLYGGCRLAAWLRKAD